MDINDFQGLNYLICHKPLILSIDIKDMHHYIIIFELLRTKDEKFNPVIFPKSHSGSTRYLKE